MTSQGCCIGLPGTKTVLRATAELILLQDAPSKKENFACDDTARAPRAVVNGKGRLSAVRIHLWGPCVHTYLEL